MIDSIRATDDAAIADVLATSLAALAIDEIDYFADRSIDDTGRSFVTEPPELEATGFTVIATHLRLAHAGDVADIATPAGIETRVGTDDTLRHLIDQVASGSVDRSTRDRDAADELASLRRMTHDPESWEVAVDRTTSHALGFVMPARTADGGSVIAYIGTVPAARGRGIGRYLLARGTAWLRTRHAGRVVADVDDTNVAMLRAAAAVGYTAFGARAHYRLAATRRASSSSA
jgi:GNAT superfamily N-acetyltransferase